MTKQPLSRLEMLGVAQEAEILKRFGEQRCRVVRVNYVPAVPFQVSPVEEGVPIPKPQPCELTFLLEDAMFGGEVFAAVTCNGLVIIRPFLWPGYDTLAKMRITTD